MKSSMILMAFAAVSSVFAAPLQPRSPRKITTVTVKGNVVEVVHITSTVWVQAGAHAPAATPTPEPEAPAAYTRPPPVERPPPVVEAPVVEKPVEEKPKEEKPKEEPAEKPVEQKPKEEKPVEAPAPAPVEAPVAPVQPPVVQPPAVESKPENESSNNHNIKEEEDDVEEQEAPAPSGKHFKGEGTHFTPGMGSCGTENKMSDPIVALAAPLFDAQTPNGNPNNNPLCGKSVIIQGANGPVKATVADRCPVCAEHDLDMTESLFTALGYDLGAGRVDIEWAWA